MAAAGEKLEVDICEPSQGWPRVVEKMQINSSRSLQKVLRQLQYIYRAALSDPRNREGRRVEDNG